MCTTTHSLPINNFKKIAVIHKNIYENQESICKHENKSYYTYNKYIIVYSQWLICRYETQGILKLHFFHFYKHCVLRNRALDP